MLSGSSPRARGTRVRLGRFGLELRFIPACAGNTKRGSPRRAPTWVHPRVRGEHNQPTAPVLHSSGSSPRARGTLRTSSQAHDCHRFIPACAGNTPCWPVGSLGLSVHPRVRGEHKQRGSAMRSLLRFIPACAGNTCAGECGEVVESVHPRVRGEHQPAEHDLAAGRRFIPACAGNTCPTPSRCCPRSVHPRVRGEHANRAPSTSAPVHPRVRGEHCVRKSDRTPASRARGPR